MDSALPQGRTVRLFERLLRLYPPHFYREFSAEILAVYFQRIGEPELEDGMARFAIDLQEVMGLALSILKERWHERKAQKGEKEESKDQMSQDAGGGGDVLQRVGMRGSIPIWIVVWILLTTGVFPAAAFLAPSLTIPYTWLYNLGIKAGLWRDIYTPFLEGLGSITGIALGIGAVQWLMLRKTLPKSGLWFATTAAPIWLIGLIFWWYSSQDITESLGLYGVILLVGGLATGLAQWLYARHHLAKAFWTIPINVLAAISFLLRLLVGSSFPSLAQLLPYLPGIITGTGMWFLLKKPKFKPPPST